MTVKELIESLQKMPQDLVVCYNPDDLYYLYDVDPRITSVCEDQVFYNKSCKPMDVVVL